MLLDLGRNDAGRVSRIGSVRVTDSFFIERYSHVMHIVSNVEGDLDPRHDPLDALAAGFPAGTVSGAPKVRAMEIIDELEREKRGPYAGCIGYFGARGEMDTCIVLRTAVVKDGQMHVQAGAGIVYDFRSGLRAAGMREQGQGAVPRRRGGGALRRAGQAGTVARSRDPGRLPERGRIASRCHGPGEVEHGEVVSWLLVPTDQDAAEAVEPGMRALHDPAACRLGLFLFSYPLSSSPLLPRSFVFPQFSSSSRWSSSS